MSMFNFFYSQLFVRPVYPTRDQSGKTFIVTGSNVGLGKEAARHLVRLNAARVIISCRNTDKGEEARKDIEQTTGRTGVLEVWPLDLLSYDSVKAFAERASQLPRLDGLLENAGIATANYKNIGGNESTITTNVVSTFLLGLLLLPKLKDTAAKHNTRPVLSIVSSEVHFMTPFNERNAPDIFARLNDEKTADMNDRYQVSKLLEVYACREIAKEKPASTFPVTVNFLNPGLCHSELGRESGIGFRIFKFFVARTTEVGSRTLVDAITRGEESHGEYLSDCKPTPPAPLVTSEDGPRVQKQVWSELCRKLEGISPGVTGNL